MDMDMDMDMDGYGLTWRDMDEYGRRSGLEKPHIIVVMRSSQYYHM